MTDLTDADLDSEMADPGWLTTEQVAAVVAECRALRAVVAAHLTGPDQDAANTDGLDRGDGAFVNTPYGDDTSDAAKVARGADYFHGRWCGECGWRVRETPACCYDGPSYISRDRRVREAQATAPAADDDLAWGRRDVESGISGFLNGLMDEPGDQYARDLLDFLDDMFPGWLRAPAAPGAGTTTNEDAAARAVYAEMYDVPVEDWVTEGGSVHEKCRRVAAAARRA